MLSFSLSFLQVVSALVLLHDEAPLKSGNVSGNVYIRCTIQIIHSVAFLFFLLAHCLLNWLNYTAVTLTYSNSRYTGSRTSYPSLIEPSDNART